jgi:hypothetical protein
MNIIVIGWGGWVRNWPTGSSNRPPRDRWITTTAFHTCRMISRAHHRG